MNVIRLFFFFAASISSSYSFGPRFHEIKKIVEDKRWDHYLESVDIDEISIDRNDTPKDYPDMYFEQPLDHFDPLVQSTYKQRYWVNSDYWNKDGGPVFLYIGGEGGLSSKVVQGGEHVELAKQYKALIFAVEHRYYGKSINQDGLALENMVHLSSQQALGDLARFHAFASEKYNLTKANTWISFGGSYPGALSAWFRVKYPHLVYGAIASSAPVRAQVNFEGYNNVVASSLSDPLVNGSKQCAANVKAAFAQIDDMLANHQNEKLSRDFDSCTTVWEEADVYTFVSNLADIFMGTVQYNNENSMVPNITSICKEMTNASHTPYDNLRRVLGVYDEILLGDNKENCTDNTWVTSIKDLLSLNVSENGGDRQWLYQTCSQFGYYQTCDVNSSCLFSRHMTLEKNLRVCSEVFAIAAEEVYKRVEFTNDYYGSDQPAGTRIVFVNGSIDPWHALGVLKDLSSTETAIYIPGTAHCANMGSNKPTDPPALTQARKMIATQIGDWLQQARTELSSQDSVLRFKPRAL